MSGPPGKPRGRPDGTASPSLSRRQAPKADSRVTPAAELERQVKILRDELERARRRELDAWERGYLAGYDARGERERQP